MFKKLPTVNPLFLFSSRLRCIY